MDNARGPGVTEMAVGEATGVNTVHRSSSEADEPSARGEQETRSNVVRNHIASSLETTLERVNQSDKRPKSNQASQAKLTKIQKLQELKKRTPRRRESSMRDTRNRRDTQLAMERRTNHSW